MRFLSILSATLLLGTGLTARCDTLAGFTGGQYNNSNVYIGQSFTVAGSGSYNNVTFDFQMQSDFSPYAVGTGFLLSQEYTGPEATLSSSTPGYLGSAVAANNFYTFDSNVTVQAGTTYYFYENAPLFADVGDANTGGPGGFYVALGLSNYNFIPIPTATYDFSVSGTPLTAAPVPEPSSLALLLTGMGSTVAAIRGRRRRL